MDLSTSPNDTRPALDPEGVAKTVRAAWAVTRDRLAAGRSDWSGHFLARSVEAEVDARLECIEAAIYAVFRVADGAEDLARDSLERTGV